MKEIQPHTLMSVHIKTCASAAGSLDHPPTAEKENKVNTCQSELNLLRKSKWCNIVFFLFFFSVGKEIKHTRQGNTSLNVSQNNLVLFK